MSAPLAADDPTITLWRAEQEKKGREESERQARRNRLLALELAFLNVRSGMPEARDDEQSALAFTARWVRLARLLKASPDLVYRPLDEIESEAHSSKAYALLFVSTALVDEATAVNLLLNAWQASKARHSEVLYWLTGGLEAEIMGKSIKSQSSALSPEHDPLPDEMKLPPRESEHDLESSPTNTTACGFGSNDDIESSVSKNPLKGRAMERMLNAQQRILILFETKPELIRAKRGTVIKAAKIRRQDGLAALRKLKQSGDYIGT